MKRAVNGKGRAQPAAAAGGRTGADREARASRSAVRRFSLSHWAANHQEVAVDSLARLCSQLVSSLMTWVVIGIALALPLGLALFVTNLQSLGDGIDQSARISLYVQAETGQAVLDDTLNSLGQRNDIASVNYVSAEQGLTDFQAATGFDEVLAGLDENPLPAVIQVTPASLDPETMQSLVTDMEALEPIESVVVDMAWVQRLNALLGLIERLTVGLAALLCIGVVLVIGNTVRLAIENRRAEIVVVKLVGGTDAWVARPFLYTGLWYGVGGGVVAVVLVSIGLLLLRGPVSDIAGLYGNAWVISGWNISNILLVLAGSGLIGWAGAWISVSRHLKAIEPS